MNKGVVIKKIEEKKQEEYEPALFVVCCQVCRQIVFENDIRSARGNRQAKLCACGTRAMHKKWLSRDDQILIYEFWSCLDC